MTETTEQIKYMVNRFLGWRLPENFNPDGGISFTKTFNESTPWPMKYEPTGTNLLDATQAEEMVRYMVEGMPAEPSPAVPDSQNYASSMPHVNCTGPCCRPDLWKAAIKGSVTSEAQTVPIPEEADFGVEPYNPEDAVMGACGLLDVIKSEWGDEWSEHDQKVRAGLSRILSRNLLSAREGSLVKSPLDESLMRSSLLKCYGDKITGFHVSTEHYRDLAEQIVSLRERIARAEATIAELEASLRKRAEDEYCTYVSAMKRPECLGWKQKVKEGIFGETELRGHTAAAIHLGRHQAFAEAIARSTGKES